MTVECFIEETKRLQECGALVMVGRLLGSGATRRVYALNCNPDLVLKIEHSTGDFCNVAEHEIWREVCGTPLEKYFAPVVDIDPWGSALLMRRTQPISEQEFRRRVKEMPAFLCDMHPGNFGWLDGRIVCHDYGYHDAISIACRGHKLKKVKHD